MAWKEANEGGKHERASDLEEVLLFELFEDG